MDKKKYTPMMQHYLQLKEENPDSFLFYRLGDFYEMFFEDAKLASQELDLVLTGRAAGNNEKVPMCGIPYHAAKSYIQRLIKKGYKVAICEQLSDPATSKGLVERGIIKIITPGTFMDENQEASRLNYLAVLHPSAFNITILLAELSTGELRALQIERSIVALQKTLLENEVKEIIIEASFDKKWRQALEEMDQFVISTQTRIDLEQEDEALLVNQDQHIKIALQLLMGYLKKTQKQHIDHFLPITLDQKKTILQMDYETKLHLELLESRSSSNKAISLYSFMNHTQSAMGSRKLKDWISHPLYDQKRIEQRQDAVEQLIDDFLLRENMKEHLTFIYDMERLASRIAYGNASPRDVLQLVSSLEHASPLMDYASKLNAYPEFKTIDRGQALYEQIKNAIQEEPSLNLKEGGVIQQGYSQKLDLLREKAEHGQSFILELESRERERTGIKSLKVGYNRVFGYYIEVRNTNLDNIRPEFGYIPKQTLANSTRYATQELKEQEESILHAKQSMIELEQKLFDDLLKRIKQDLFMIHTLSSAIATLDVLLSLAILASQEGYVRPTFHSNQAIHVVEGKHPILAKRIKNYISNDWQMPEQETIQLITGPNMGGKSTYMRQNALLVIMAQMGSFVPAKKADLPLFDRIFTRIGASDDLLTGKSTFMVEMIEANYALQYGTKHSLILFDEIGRGTATYDGMAISQAIMEYIDSALQAKTLFSTHYHELTDLAQSHGSIKNVHVDVKEKNNEVEFRYRILEGKADKSFGINVARLAHLPSIVLERASQLLKGYESNPTIQEHQPSLFIMDEVKPEKSKLIEMIHDLDVDQLSPREALECLYELKALQEEMEE